MTLHDKLIHAAIEHDRKHWKALTNHTKIEECGEHWTAVQGPDWAFDVHTPPCVGCGEHHAVVEGIATAINCHQRLVNALQRLSEKVLRANSIRPNLEDEDWAELLEIESDAHDVLAKAKGAQ